jgi:hypothetical protein
MDFKSKEREGGGKKRERKRGRGEREWRGSKVERCNLLSNFINLM